MAAGVALCADLASHGIEPDAVRARLEAQGVPAAVFPGHCGRIPSAWSNTWDRTVVATCPGGPSGEEVRSRARRTGADPAVGATSVDIVSASAHGPPDRRIDRAALVLAARVAGVWAAAPSPPEAFRMALQTGKLSRRSLLAFGVGYVPVATVGGVGCRGTSACGLCVDACPVDAIDRTRAVPEVRVEACIGCGACVSACPVESATRLPGADLAGFEAELATLTGDAAASGVVFGCAGFLHASEDRLPGTWLPVALPCLSIVTPAWALAALAAGARAIAFRGCGGACRAGPADRLGAIVVFVREALSFAGVADPGDRVRLLLTEDGDLPAAGPPPEELTPLGTGRFVLRLREPAASASALRALGVGSGSIASPAAPFGRVAFDAGACTLCGLCADVCPTAAIRFDEGPVAASLELDRSTCIGCDHCASICPEGALSVERGVDLDDLGAGAQVLKRSVLARCRRCGDRVAPTAMLERLRPLLDPSVLATIEGLCQRCRGLR
jgi:ferredoxin